MNGRSITKEIMKQKGVTNAALAKELGISQAALWDRLDSQPRDGKPRKDIPVSLLAELLGGLKYKIIVVPNDTPLPDGGYEIDVPVKEEVSSHRIKLSK